MIAMNSKFLTKTHVCVSVSMRTTKSASVKIMTLPHEPTHTPLEADLPADAEGERQEHMTQQTLVLSRAHVLVQK